MSVPHSRETRSYYYFFVWWPKARRAIRLFPFARGGALAGILAQALRIAEAHHR
jgi:hypothetical protein